MDCPLLILSLEICPFPLFQVESTGTKNEDNCQRRSVAFKCGKRVAFSRTNIWRIYADFQCNEFLPSFIMDAHSTSNVDYNFYAAISRILLQKIHWALGRWRLECALCAHLFWRGGSTSSPSTDIKTSRFLMDTLATASSTLSLSKWSR